MDSKKSKYVAPEAGFLKFAVKYDLNYARDDTKSGNKQLAPPHRSKMRGGWGTGNSRKYQHSVWDD